jgi:hypothetical protein
VRGLAVQHLQQQRAVRVFGGLGLGDLAFVHQRLHPGVVVGELAELACSQQISAGVADVGDAVLAT